MSVDQAIELACDHGRARVHPIGATVLSWVPQGGSDLLWVASAARYQPGSAIRGGIPVCWPWFATAGRPSHGLVRHQPWVLLRQDATPDGAWAEWGFECRDENWSFDLTYRVQVDQHLTVQLVHQDRSGTPSEVGGALHTYLRLDPTRARVLGVAARAWDKVAEQERVVDGPVPLTGPLDLVVPHDGAVIVEDGSTSPIHVEGEGHTDVVLWNPGAAAVSDLTPGEEHAFACVETAIVSSTVAVAPNGVVTLGARFRRAVEGA